MKSTGIVRKVDELGRIVLPIELRRTLDIAVKDSLEIYVDGNSIVLKKYEPACVFCNDAKNVLNYKGKNICPNCLAELKRMYRKNGGNGGAPFPKKRPGGQSARPFFCICSAKE